MATSAGDAGFDAPALRPQDWRRPRQAEVRPGPRLSRGESAAAQLIAIAEAAAPGDRLGSKEELRARCEVSVGTFNEAVRIAQSRGVISVRPGPGGGVFAAAQSPMVRLGNSVLALDTAQTSVAEAVRIRDALDPLLIEDALWHASPADIAEMRELLAEMAAAAGRRDPDGFVRANWALHARIAAVSPNPMLRSLYVNLLDQIESHTLAVLPDTERPLPEYVADRLTLHTELVDAIDDRDRDRALALIARHVTSGARPGGGEAILLLSHISLRVTRRARWAKTRRQVMAEQRSTIEFTVDGMSIAALTAGPAAGGAAFRGKPLIAALHGGTYTARYFDVAGSPQGSFLDAAAAAGYPAVCFDRPGYGGSAALPPAQNTFGRHAQLLADAIAQAAARFGGDGVFLAGHSIGGMIAMMIAAGDIGFRLTGLSVTGMGAVIRAGGPAHALASLPPDETVDLPYDQRDQVMFGPASTWTADAVRAAHGSYAPTPVRELIQAPQWPDEHLPGLAPRITVPVHNALAEFDALWDSTPATVEQFGKLLTAAPFVDASIARATGHSIDHHILGHVLHLRQLAFAEECQLWASRRS